MLINLLGFICFAGFIAGLVFQVWKVWRTKSATDINPLWPLLSIIACISGAIYVTASTNFQPPFWLIVDYTLGLTLHIILLILYYRYERQRTKKT